MSLPLTVLGVVLVVLVIWSAYGYMSVRGIEKPEYTVIEKKGTYEIRRYESYIVAETYATGDFKDSLNKGFSRIAGYIFGDNIKKEKIAMTVPVGERTTETSEKIAMTVPVVSQDRGSNERIISFVMPRKYTLETLPVPKDERVTLRTIPARVVAVHSFSWSNDARTVAKQKAAFVEQLKKEGVTMLGAPEAAFYNPPWTPPYMLHSEIHIPIAY